MPDDPTDKPTSTPAATEGASATDASSRVSALLLGPRLRLRPALADAVMVASTHTLRTLPPAEQFAVVVGAVLLGSIPELRPRFASRVALATKAISLEPVEMPIPTPAAKVGAIAKEADTSNSVMVLLPAAMPALPPIPIEGVIATSTQISKALPPAEQDDEGTEVVMVGCCEPSMPALTPMLALAPISTPPVPADMPRFALAAAESAIPTLVDASTTVMLPSPTLTAPPMPTEGVITASRHMSSRLSKTEQVVDGDAIAMDADMGSVREGVLAVVAGIMMFVTEAGKMVEVIYDRLAALSPPTAVDPMSLAVAPEVAPNSLVIAAAVISEARSDEVSTTEDGNCVVIPRSLVLRGRSSELCIDEA